MWHSLDLKKVFEKLNTSEQGLSSEEARQRLKKSGLNKLPGEKPLSRSVIFVNQFRSPLVYILLIAGIITLILSDYSDGAIIFGAIILNTIVGYIQENKASQSLSALKKALQEKAIVIRDGNEKEILQEELSPGDVFVLKAGDKAPSDGRLIASYDLRINESALTGEWFPAEKNPEILPGEIPLADRDNMVYMATIIDNGRGIAVATETGINTEIGKVAALIKGIKEEKTPYQKKVAHLSKTIGVLIAFICCLLFILGIAMGRDLFQMFLTSVAVAVAAIPEGLPIAVTVILALGTGRILKKRGLIRKLIAAETLGSTSIICSDKTGTLTEAKMRVAGIYTGTRELLADGEKYSEAVNVNGRESHILVLKIAALCNEAFIENPEDELHQWIVRGRPTEKALLLAAIQAGLSKKALEREWPKIDELPFDPDFKYIATLHQFSGVEDIIYVMGAPEKILEMSKYIEIDGDKEEKLEKLEAFREKYETLAGRGLRVLGAAFKKIPSGHLISRLKPLSAEISKRNLGEASREGLDLITNSRPKEVQKNSEKRKIYEADLIDMVFVGLIALHDPIRKEAKEAINTCRKAGMRPIIVTGDHRLTAQAVAKELGLPANPENIIEGRDLERMSDEEFMKRLDDIEIYARTEPAQKSRIVRAWQARGEIVAMTGDGINDAPALKQADIGVALGSGVEVAKEASDLVLLNDNFSTIVGAVEEGRVIIDNIKKTVTLLVSQCFSEIILIGASIIAGLPLPILPVQILWENLIEGNPQGIALAFEPKEKDVMERKPEDHKAALLTREMKTTIFGFGIFTSFILLGLFLWLLKTGLPLAEIRTIIFAALSIDTFFYAFSCKNLRKNIWRYNPFSNLYLVGCMALSFLSLLIVVYLPVFQNLLKTVSLNLFDWLLILGLGMINLILIEAVKWHFIRKIRKSAQIQAQI